MNTAIDMVGTNLESGTKTYNLNFCKNLAKKKLNKIIYIFACEDFIEESKIRNINIKFITKSNILKITFLRILWMQFILPFELKIYKINQLYSPMNLSPLVLKLLKIRSVLALHTNLPWLFFSKMPGSFIRNYITKLMMQFSIHLSDHLVVASNTAKKEIIDILSIEPNKVSSIYLGIDDKFLDRNEKGANLIKNFNYNNYILSILSCVKYHNIISLLKAFRLISKKKNSDLKFVLVMQILDKDYYKEIIKFIDYNFGNNEVIIFSNLSNSYLINLYKKAKLYIFSSYCEVFGLTSLEAMSQNCPVILSNKSSLKEINSNAADYFDPDDEIQIKENINRLLEDNDYRENLIKRGKNHYKKFSWEKTVHETLEVLGI